MDGAVSGSESVSESKDEIQLTSIDPDTDPDTDPGSWMRGVQHMALTKDNSARDSLRLFVALWLPETLAGAAWRRLERLRPDGRGVRWVRREQLHLTLKFLGETPADKLPAVQEALAGAAAGGRPVDLRLTAGGVFPPAGPPRVLWLGLEPAGELGALAGAVEKALAPLGFPPEGRPFRPHLTLGRAEPGAAFDRAVLAREIAEPPAAVDSMALIRSDLGPGGPRYTTLCEWRLGG